MFEEVRVFLGALNTSKTIVLVVFLTILGSILVLFDSNKSKKNLSQRNSISSFDVREILAIRNVSWISLKLKRLRLRANGSVAFTLSQSGLRPYGNPLSENFEWRIRQHSCFIIFFIIKLSFVGNTIFMLQSNHEK